MDKYAPETEVHKYLHSRLASFDTASLYELHYQMITLGKVSAALPCCLQALHARTEYPAVDSVLVPVVLLLVARQGSGQGSVHAAPTPSVNQKQMSLQES